MERTETASASSRGGLSALVVACVLGVVAGAVYVPALGGGYLFDDVFGMLKNGRIAAAGTGEASLWSATGGGQRPLTDLTFAAQMRWVGWDGEGQPDAWVFRSFNIAVHAVGVGLMFLLVRGCLRVGERGSWWRSRAGVIALVWALVWGVHPLTTQGVSYVVQRSESLMSVLFLGAVYALLRCATGGGGVVRAVWGGVAVALVGLSMGAKPAVVLAPVVLVVLDGAVLSGGWGGVAKRWWVHAGVLVATLGMALWTGVLRAVLSVSETRDSTVGFDYAAQDGGHGALEHLLTSGPVIVHYLKLVFWPAELVLDYGWPAVRLDAGGVGVSVIAACVFVGVLVAATGVAVWKRSVLGALGVVFFGVLAPTQSVIPVRDVAFEHRMYLPSAAVLGAVVIGGAWAARRLGGGVARAIGLAGLVAVVGFGWRTVDRNVAYRDTVALLRDDASARPGSARTQYNLSVGLARRAEVERGGTDQMTEEELREAFEAAARASELAPESAKYAGQAASMSRQLATGVGVAEFFEPSVKYYRRALELDPGDARRWAAYALVERARGDDAAALRAFASAYGAVGGERSMRRLGALEAARSEIALARPLGSAGLAAQRAGDADESRELFERAVGHLERALGWCARGRALGGDAGAFSGLESEANRLLGFARRSLDR